MPFNPRLKVFQFFFDIAMLVSDRSLGLELSLVVSSLQDVFPLFRFPVLPLILFSWSSSAWHFCLFSPVAYKGTKWFGENHAPALLTKFPSLDHKINSGLEESKAVGFLGPKCRKSRIQRWDVEQSGLHKRLTMPQLEKTTPLVWLTCVMRFGSGDPEFKSPSDH